MPALGTVAMRPKTFPAAPYVGNTRQRLQEIKEGLKQPAKLVSQALHGSSSRNEGGKGADSKSGKDTTSRQQQLRPPQKFNNYQNALREIRKSLKPFESGSTSGSGHPAGAGEVNRQMLQELVNAGCDKVSFRDRECFQRQYMILLWEQMGDSVVQLSYLNKLFSISSILMHCTQRCKSVCFKVTLSY